MMRDPESWLRQLSLKIAQETKALAANASEDMVTIKKDKIRCALTHSNYGISSLGTKSIIMLHSTRTRALVLMRYRPYKPDPEQFDLVVCILVQRPPHVQHMLNMRPIRQLVKETTIRNVNSHKLTQLAVTIVREFNNLNDYDNFEKIPIARFNSYLHGTPSAPAFTYGLIVGYKTIEGTQVEVEFEDKERFRFDAVKYPHINTRLGHVVVFTPESIGSLHFLEFNHYFKAQGREGPVQIVRQKDIPVLL